MIIRSGLLKVEVTYIYDLSTLRDVEQAASQRNASSQLVPTPALQDLQSDLLAGMMFHVEGQRRSRLDTDQHTQQIREGSKMIVLKETGDNETWYLDSLWLSSSICGFSRPFLQQSVGPTCSAVWFVS